MNLLAIAGRLARHPWSRGHVVASVCGALAARGFTIHLACQSLDDPEQFACTRTIATHDRFLETASDFPFGFARWAEARRRITRHDAVLSFSRAVAGDVYFPIDPGGASWARRAAQTHGVRNLPLALARHHGFARAWAHQAVRRVPRTPVAELGRIIAVGSTSAGEASRLLTPTGLAERVASAPFFSTIGPLPEEQRADLRARTRALLKVGESQRMLLVSAAGPVGRTLDGLLGAVASCARRDPKSAPILAVLAKECFAVHISAVRAGAASQTRVLTLTTHMQAALAAADLCALAMPAALGQFEHGAMGRFAADSVRMGRPILALSGASGYDLARRTLPNASSAGLVVENNTSTAWQRTLRTAMDERWLTEASAAARTIGAELPLKALVDLLEANLRDRGMEHAR